MQRCHPTIPFPTRPLLFALGFFLAPWIGPAFAAPPVPAIDPAGLPGPLVIAGGDTADARQAVFDLAGKEKAVIVIIPGIERSLGDPKVRQTVLKPWRDLKPQSVGMFVSGTREDGAMHDPLLAKALQEATGVWIVAPDAGKLLARYRDTPVEKELKKLHARGGVIGVAGDSARLLGELMPAANEKTSQGLGLLPGFVIDAPANPDSELSLGAIIADNRSRVGLGILPEAGIVIRGRVARVIGEGSVTVHIAGGGGRKTAADPHPADSLLDIVQLRRAAANRAAANPFPPAKPPVPVVEKGTLVVVGGGEAGPEIWKTFIEKSGGPDALIVVIPTAMEDPLPKTIGEEATLKRFGARNVKSLHTRDPKQADDPKFSEVLTTAGGVWFSGGRQWRFVDAYAGTLTEKRFHEVLARGGAIGGSSAGASIQSEYMPRGHPLGNTVMAAEGYERGLGFLPGCAVDQHFFARNRTADMTGLMKRYPQYLGIGLDEGTAIVVHGTVAEVIGKTRVGFYDTAKKPVDGKDYEEVKTGEKYDLKARKKLEK
jgi:cyanophycinase